MAPRAIVAGHGNFSDGMISAVNLITGRGEALLACSNIGMGREEIEATLRQNVKENDIQVIFTDLPSGSATIAARKLMREFPTLSVVTGANLATLIDFVFRESESPVTAAEHAATRGRDAISVITNQ